MRGEGEKEREREWEKERERQRQGGREGGREREREREIHVYVQQRDINCTKNVRHYTQHLYTRTCKYCIVHVNIASYTHMYTVYLTYRCYMTVLYMYTTEYMMCSVRN